MEKTYKIKYIYKKLKLKIIKAIYTTELKPKKGIITTSTPKFVLSVIVPEMCIDINMEGREDENEKMRVRVGGR